jgi:hypothetical protein
MLYNNSASGLPAIAGLVDIAVLGTGKARTTTL